MVSHNKRNFACRTVHDFKPKKFDAEQCNVLCNFAEMTVREIQRITESSMQRSMSMNLENEQLLRSIDDCSDGVVLLDVRIPRWPVLFSNEGWSQLTGSAGAKGLMQLTFLCHMSIFYQKCDLRAICSDALMYKRSI